ncbi:hypothetical protein T440DRAFT_252540 [Plenodomus tracheiphilus IPT5]|uniref:Dehydrin-like protein 3 n=1 Tax=Plenodomus tracheiphilus IPT5 TaxID=1408161 RepID=A0A6A7AT54_9PLEO|nr:hypothetical protein T440DRAFT_252540 [Plenodomus tracheiphilus IPT5]
MEKIKNVLHGHKKSEEVAAHDTHPSSSATDGQTHPIYDHMTERKEGKHAPLGQPVYDIKTTDGQPYTTLAQPQDSAGLHGKAEYTGTGGAIGHDGSTGHSATTSSHHNSQSTNQTHAKDGGAASIVPLKVQEKLPESVERAVPNAIHDTGDNNKHGQSDTSAVATGEHRPNVKTSGTEMSTASIKSGVIGFGPGEQGHAALPTNNSAEHNLSRDHVVGGGDLGRSEGHGLQSSTGVGPTSQATAGTGAGLGAIKEQHPYDNTLRQESYTVDTNRAFPLAGGVTSHPGENHGASTTRPAETVSSAIPSTPQTSTSQYPAEPTSTLHQGSITGREPGLQQQDDGVGHSHGREGLAGAAAAAAAVGAAQRSDRSETRGVGTHDHSSTSTAPVTDHAQPKEEQGLLAKAKTLIGLGTTKEHNTPREELIGNTTSRSTQDHHPEALAAATAAAAGAASKSSQPTSSTQSQSIGTQQGQLAGSTNSTGLSNPTSGSLTNERPQASRLESHHRHIPGEFISTPGEHGNTFLDYTSVVQPTSTSTVPALGVEPTSVSAATASYVDPSSSLGSFAGTHSGVTAPSTADQHELRHTGTLDEPIPRSSEEHHHGRDAALAGGLGAGAAGLGAHAIHHSQAASDVGSSKPLYEETSPYSSKMLDPRVSGAPAPLPEQRFDPHAKTQVSAPHTSQTSGPADISSGSGSQHHLGRDAGIVGGAAVGGAALHHSLQRNDTPGSGTGSGGLPETSHSSVFQPSAPHQSSNIAAPLASSTTAAPRRPSSGDDKFYGTAGAPAPIADHTAQHQQPSSSLGQAPTSTSTIDAGKDADHHYGRNAGFAGAGAVGAAGVYAATRDDDTERGLGSTTTSSSNTGLASSRVPVSATGAETGPASKTIGPHSSNIANVLDPRVKPDPALQKSHETTGPHQSDTFNRLDPKAGDKTAQQSHHYGRDAALVGGAGATGYGAHEAIQAYGDHRMTQPSAAMSEQRYDPIAPGAKASSPVAPKSEYNYNDSTIHSNVNRTEPETHSNTGRNAALGGLGGAGLVGAGAYAGSNHANSSQQLPLHQKQDLTSSAQLGSAGQSVHPVQGTAASSYPTQGTIAPQNTHVLGSTGQQPYGATRDPSEHDKRNAALLGAGGAAAVGGGAYALSQQDDRESARLAEREQERLKKEAHDREKEQHRLDKEQHKHDKEVHKHDKAVAAHEKDEHHFQKEHDKEQKRLAKEQHEREKEAEKAEKEKKGGLLGFLHRDKSKKEKSAHSPESSPRTSREGTRRASRDSPRHSKEYAAGAGALGAGAGAMAYDENHPDHPRWKGKNLLHKDPPKGHPAREALEHQSETGLGGKREHVGVDGPIGDANLISGDRQTRSGVYGAHPASDLDRNTTVIEPHTGLPMNIGKYGAGTGGTDGNAAIHGQHEHGAAPGQTGTDWSAVKKGDTPY